MFESLYGQVRCCLLLACAMQFATLAAFSQNTACDTTNGGYTLSIEQVASDLGTFVVGPQTVDLTGYSTYRVYLHCENASDKLSAVEGSANRPLHLSTTTDFYQSALFGGSNGALANVLSPALFGAYPDLQYDSWVTIGIEQAPNSANGETTVSLVEDVTNPLSIGFAGGDDLVINSAAGSTWFIDNSDIYTNGLAGADGKVLVAQVTTDGEVSGQMGMQVFRNGISDEANCIRPYLGFQSHGCLEPAACNYTPDVLFDNGSCDFCSCPDSLQILSSSFASDSVPEYGVDLDLIVDHDTTGIPALAGMKTYRLYATVAGAGDIVNAVFGNDAAPLDISSSTAFHQSGLGAETPSNISPLLFDFPGFEDLAYDSWATIGIDRSPTFMDGSGYEAVNIAGDWVAPFEAGGAIQASGAVGGTWFAFPNTSNVVPDDDLRVLIGQFTTDGVISGTLGYQVIPGNAAAGDDIRLPFSFTSAALGNYVYLYPDICTCENVDGDYLCDNEDDCVGAYDECGVCNGPGATGDCGCSDIPAGDCDCDGNQLDALGVCGGTCTADADGNGTCDDSEVPGCTDSDASNFNAGATQDDGSCFYLGCTDPTASNYDASADTDDGNCQYPGCIDPTAWNYDSDANVDDGSCQANACGVEGTLIIATNYVFTPAAVSIPTGGTVVWQNESSSLHDVNGVTNSITGLSFDNPEAFSLPGIVGNDAGVCIGSFSFNAPGVYQYDCSIGIHADLGMVATITVGTGGCTDAAASNYSDAAEYNDGTCTYPGCIDPSACNFDTAANLDDGSCQFATGCSTCSGATDGSGTVVNNDTDGDGVCDADEVAGCQDASACNYNTAATDSDDSCTYVDGICETCMNGLIVDNDTDNDGVCNADEIAGCQDQTACNYNAAATDSDNSCTYVDGICETCESGVIVDNDTDGDGVCNADEIAGCQDATACNYNAAATDSDDSCTYVDGICETCENGIIIDNDTDNDGVCDSDEIAGCQDQTACNYNAAATDSDNSCTYVDGICETCENGVIVDNDTDDDGVCDSNEIAGCQDQTACNYNAAATDSDDSCTYVDGICETCENGIIIDNDTDNDGVCDADEIAGCQDQTACNYNAVATDSDDSCTYVDGICETCENGVIIDNDTDDDGVCDSNEIAGCQDQTACNYNAAATDSDDSCTYVDGICETCENGLIVDNDTDGDGVCNTDEVAGCQDQTACNYNAAATDSDDSCTYVDGICETCENGIIIDNDTDNDGVCNADEIAGCQDASACNYNAAATDSDNSCTYVDGICETCENGVIVDNDTDGDGVCDTDEVAGCQDQTACNYNAAATDSDDSCTYVDGICETCENGIIVDNDTDNDGVCNADEIAGCQDAAACNYNAAATDSDDSCTYVDGICETCENGVIVDNDTDNDGVCNADEIAGCQDQTACNYNAAATDSDDSCTYVDGICETCENGIIVDNDTDNDGVCDADEIAGCQDQTACNYNPAATDSDDSCTYVDGICETCENGVIVDNDTDDDGVCNADEIAGCQDQTACNYNAAATDSDDSCTYVDGICETCINGEVIDNDADDDGICDADETAGCTDPNACNTGVFTDTDNSLCTYVDGICETCESGVIVDNDTDGDGVCNTDEIAGCQDATACNYNAAATDSDDSCTYVDGICETCENGIIIDNDTDNDGVCDSDEIAGCQDQTACNYNAAATDSDDSCTYVDGICETCENGVIIDNDTDDDGVCDSNEIAGCQDQTACNYNAAATDSDDSCTYVDGICETCENGIIVDNDTDNDGVCNADEIAGCQDQTACNYNPAATDSDDSCTYVDGICETCENGIIVDNDTDGDGVCNADEIAGCQDQTACNYNAAATDSDDSCTYVDGICETCENGIIVDNDTDNDGVCNADEIAGCQDAAACNYNAAATDSDDSCTYVDGICETCENGIIVDNDTDGDGVCNADEIAGCQDQAACNYNAAATDSDDSCTYVDGICETCENGIIVDNDTDNDGVCNADEIAGCQDAAACNYNAAATDSDDSCTYVDGICETCENGVIVDNDTDNDGVCNADEIAGCQDQTACNYNAAATDSDDSCTYVDGICETCENGIIVDNDTDNDGVCDADEIAGCQDQTACNYNPAATDSDDSCTYAESGLDCNGDCLNDTDGDGICDEDEAECHDYNGNGICDADDVYGCTYSGACNFNAGATADDGSCTYAAEGFNCDGSSEDGGTEFAGCTYSEALNFSAAATFDDGSCVFLDVIGGVGPCYFDVTGDNFVNTPDLLIFLQYWEASCE